jgi:aminoglycoside 6-adenylyltransferase
VDHTATLRRITAWAGEDDAIRALVVTGSVAAGTADEWSDLDIEVFTRNPAALLEDAGWHSRFGEVLVVEALPNPDWYPTRLVYYIDGKIDFAIAPADAVGRYDYERPFKVLVDKDGLTTHLTLAMATGEPPSSETFDECIHWFYAAALMIAKSVARSELWEAKNRDADLKTELLRMIEWDHRARYGWDFDTWHVGKRMKYWMDEDVRAALVQCWGRFDGTDTIRALWRSIALFKVLGYRTSDVLGYAPFDASSVETEVERIVRHVVDHD